MKSSLRIVGSTFLLAVCVLGVLALVHQDAQAKQDYACCTYPVMTVRGEHVLALGVWFDGKCRCSVISPAYNPNGCPLWCPIPR